MKMIAPFWPTFLAGLTFGVVIGVAAGLGAALKYRNKGAPSIPIEPQAKEAMCLDCNTIHGHAEPCPTCGRRDNWVLMDRVAEKRAAA